MLFVKSGNFQVSGNQNIFKSGNIANKNMVYKNPNWEKHMTPGSCTSNSPAAAGASPLHLL